jgi:hypothetical protein
MDFVLFAALVKLFGLGWYHASVVSFSFATLVNYMLSIRFVFDSGARCGKQYEIALVFLASAMGLVVHGSHSSSKDTDYPRRRGSSHSRCDANMLRIPRLLVSNQWLAECISSIL